MFFTTLSLLASFMGSNKTRTEKTKDQDSDLEIFGDLPPLHTFSEVEKGCAATLLDLGKDVSMKDLDEEDIGMPSDFKNEEEVCTLLGFLGELPSQVPMGTLLPLPQPQPEQEEEEQEEEEQEEEEQEEEEQEEEEQEEEETFVVEAVLGHRFVGSDMHILVKFEGHTKPEWQNFGEQTVDYAGFVVEYFKSSGQRKPKLFGTHVIKKVSEGANGGFSAEEFVVDKVIGHRYVVNSCDMDFLVVFEGHKKAQWQPYWAAVGQYAGLVSLYLKTKIPKSALLTKK